MLQNIFKTVTTIGLFLVINNHSFAQGKSGSLHLKIENILINKGTVYISLYNNEKDFMKTPFVKRKFSVDQLKNGLTFASLPVGEYAITIYQGLNENGMLDKSASIPIEPYGLSNNPSTYPSYANTKFDFKQNKTITIGFKN